MADFPVRHECASGHCDFFNHGGNGGIFPPTSHERHSPGVLF